MATEEGIKRYLMACRHDIAHLNGTSNDDHAAWATAHYDEAMSIYGRVRQGSDDRDDSSEAALLAVKRWAQGSYYRDPAGSQVA